MMHQGILSRWQHISPTNSKIWCVTYAILNLLGLAAAAVNHITLSSAVFIYTRISLAPAWYRSSFLSKAKIWQISHERFKRRDDGWLIVSFPVVAARNSGPGRLAFAHQSTRLLSLGLKENINQYQTNRIQCNLANGSDFEKVENT